MSEQTTNPLDEATANPEEIKLNVEAGAELDKIRLDVEAGNERTASVRELLRWFGAQRRRAGIVERIEAELEVAGLRTDPHFTTTWIDSPVTFRKRETAQPGSEPGPAAANHAAEPESASKADEFKDTDHLVRMLKAANRDVIRVNPQDSIRTAITLMLAHDFSQLAVMTSERELKGAISWKSIGSRLSQGKQPQKVAEVMEPASEVPDTASLFEATKKIIETDYVFVRSMADRKIIGIVTATDLSEQFQRLSEPFLLLGRIENQIRRMISHFDVETLRAACHDGDPDRKAKVTKASDLTFGEYLRLLQREENWRKLPFFACGSTFCKELDEVRELRNDIMHFHPDELEEGDFEQLRRFSRLLERLETLSR
ncbi:CBS domain-containing protein [Azospirillum oryzae]|uniref:CBS domain-containing protein n=1 Tax=Azospirillum oryzae TaxID=286727 RepID=A0A1X7FNE3_9PROT|nr:CBS domain-containing protein [Azospirillum oryzae]SMF55613.1 CBS domain-containing protein [Azospirillum oryzae]